MRSADGLPATPSRRIGDSRQRLGVRSRVGPTARERLHYPDLLLRTADGRRIAVELELPRSVDPAREILTGYGADSRIDAVVYVVDERAAGARGSAPRPHGPARREGVRTPAPVDAVDGGLADAARPRLGAGSERRPRRRGTRRAPPTRETRRRSDEPSRPPVLGRTLWTVPALLVAARPAGAVGPADRGGRGDRGRGASSGRCAPPGPPGGSAAAGDGRLGPTARGCSRSCSVRSSSPRTG